MMPAIVSTDELKVIEANNILAVNFGIPTPETDCWEIVKQSYDGTLFFIWAPTLEGKAVAGGQFTTYEQGMVGVLETGIIIEDAQPSWWPPDG